MSYFKRKSQILGKFSIGSLTVSNDNNCVSKLGGTTAPVYHNTSLHELLDWHRRNPEGSQVV
jgi:hypothetical protein